jgi:mannosyltransferase OCH1-like enzyme
MIPKLVHQIWYQGEKVPDKYVNWKKTWKEKNPNYDYILWDESAMLKILERPEWNWFLPTWKAYPKMIQRIDTFKWVALYEYGGCYVDMDMECIKPLDTLLAEDCEFAIGEFKSFYKFWGKFVGVNLIVNNAFIASKPNHPFLIEFLKESQKIFLKFKDNVKKSSSISKTTGPLLVSKLVSKYMKKYNLTLVDHRLVEIYPPELSKHGKDGYIVHHSECTWSEKSSLVHLFDPVTTNPSTSIIIIVVIFLLALFLAGIFIFAIIKLQNMKRSCHFYIK